MTVGTLSPLQLELLKIYSFKPSEADLLEIKRLLSNYFAEQLIKKVDTAIQEKNITEDDLESWLICTGEL